MGVLNIPHSKFELFQAAPSWQDDDAGSQWERALPVSLGRVALAGKPVTVGRADADCAICLESLGGEAAVELPCGPHRFHPACAEQWLSRGRTCPVCRSDTSGRIYRSGR